MTAPVTCRELIGFLAGYLDGELAPATVAEFERHLLLCASCREYLATYRETIAMARSVETAPQLRIEDVPEDLVQAVLVAIAKK